MRDASGMHCVWKRLKLNSRRCNQQVDVNRGEEEMCEMCGSACNIQCSNENTSIVDYDYSNST